MMIEYGSVADTSWLIGIWHSIFEVRKNPEDDTWFPRAPRQGHGKGVSGARKRSRRVLLAGQCTRTRTHPRPAGRCARSSRMPTGPSEPIRGVVTSPSASEDSKMSQGKEIAAREQLHKKEKDALNAQLCSVAHALQDSRERFVETRSNPSPVRVLSSHSGDREISSSPGPSPSQGTPVNLRLLSETKDLTRQIDWQWGKWQIN